jgi:hypothetical protein
LGECCQSWVEELPNIANGLRACFSATNIEGYEEVSVI